MTGASEAETVACTFRDKFDGTDFGDSTATVISLYVPNQLKRLFELVGPENLMVESNELKQIGWLMREMGTVINIGNLNYDQVAEIEPLRYGIGWAVDYAIYDPYFNQG